MTKFHVNNEGEPGPCDAKIQCRFGGDGDHHSTKEEARAAYEEKMSDESIPEPLEREPDHSEEVKPEISKVEEVSPLKLKDPESDYKSLTLEIADVDKDLDKLPIGASPESRVLLERREALQRRRGIAESQLPATLAHSEAIKINKARESVKNLKSRIEQLDKLVNDPRQPGESRGAFKKRMENAHAPESQTGSSVNRNIEMSYTTQSGYKYQVEDMKEELETARQDLEVMEGRKPAPRPLTDKEKHAKRVEERNAEIDKSERRAKEVYERNEQNRLGNRLRRLFSGE